MPTVPFVSYYILYMVGYVFEPGVDDRIPMSAIHWSIHSYCNHHLSIEREEVESIA